MHTKLARPAATAPEETMTTSRPASTLAETNWARPKAKRGVSPPPSAASRLLPTLRTARRHSGTVWTGKGEALSEGIVVMGVGSGVDQCTFHSWTVSVEAPRSTSGSRATMACASASESTLHST